ncbi:MAG: hypothetical protein ACO3RV_00965 [Luteolibacter sp.]
MKKFVFIGVTVAVFLGFAVWWYSPKQQVKRRTVTLLDTFNLEPGASKRMAPLGSYTLNALLAPDIELHTTMGDEFSGTFPREELESVYEWLARNAKECRVEPIKIHSVASHGDLIRVQVHCAVRVMVEDALVINGGVAIQMDWQLDSLGKWRLVSASWHEREAAP